MINKQIFFKKLPLRIFTLIGILMALGASYVIVFIWQFPQNNIPSGPASLVISINQKSPEILDLDSIKVTNNYPQDYQLDLKSNYYVIQLKKGSEILFTGKTVKSYEVVNEEFFGPTIAPKITESQVNNAGVFRIENLSEGLSKDETTFLPLKNFQLNLPYYSQATTLSILDEKGVQLLSIELSKYNLEAPIVKTKTCGNGVCTSGENIINCVQDCSYNLKQLFRK